MIYTGETRSASGILEQQNKEMGHADKRQIVRDMVQMAYELKHVLERNQIDDFGRILHEGWLLKQSIMSGISNDHISELYQKGLDAGALGGKLLGAGGSGFILFYCPEHKQEKFRREMQHARELPFQFENYGSKIIYIAD
jgi:D-glycero-alpha-D-manno-heptose-7-phosphate kinase